MRPITSYKADGTPVPPNREPERTPAVTYSHGRAYRNEGLEGSSNTSLTQAERQRLVERHFEKAELRQAESDLNLLAALQLGRRLKEG